MKFLRFNDGCWIFLSPLIVDFVLPGVAVLRKFSKYAQNFERFNQVLLWKNTELWWKYFCEIQKSRSNSFVYFSPHWGTPCETNQLHNWNPIKDDFMVDLLIFNLTYFFCHRFRIASFDSQTCDIEEDIIIKI